MSDSGSDDGRSSGGLRRLTPGVSAWKLLFLVGLVAGVAWAGLSTSTQQPADGWTDVEAGVPVGVDGGPTVAIGFDAEANLTRFADANRLVWKTNNSGAAVFASPVATSVTAEQLVGSYTKLSSVSAAQNLTINPADKSPLLVEGAAATVEFRDAASNDNRVDLTLDDTTTPVNVTFTGLSIEPQTAYLVTGGTVAASGQVNKSGAVHFEELSTSVERDFEIINTSDSNTATRPTVNNSTASPSGYVEAGADGTPTLSIDIGDADFPDDVVNVSWYVDRQYVSSKTYTQNTTASLTYQEDIVGNHAWNVSIKDSTGLTNSSRQFFFSMPRNLSVRDEQNPGSLVNKTIDIRYFFPEDEGQPPLIVSKTNTDGTINMTGLPGNRDFVAVARAEGYTTRRVWVSSFFQQDRIYLLNKSTADVLTTTFRLQDYSGKFPPKNTVLQVQAPINDTWRVVEGDYFGATGKFDAKLRRGVRHRLVLRNAETGARRVLGSFTPTRNGSVQVIEVTSRGTVNVIREGPFVSFEPSTGAVPALNQTTQSVTIDNGTKDMSQYAVDWMLNDGSGNVTLASQTGNVDAGETLSATLNLTNQTGGTLYVVVEYATDSGKTGREVKAYTIRESFNSDASLMQAASDVKASVNNPGVFTSFVGIFGSILGGGFVASRLRLSTEGVASVVTGSLLVFALIKWVPFTVPLIAGLTLVIAMALRRQI